MPFSRIGKNLRSGVKAFTLIELLVVIALISLLVTVMVPVALTLFKGKGLAMSGNNLGGFLAHARSETMNTRRTHVLVFYNEVTSLNEQGSLYSKDVGPGIVLFRINPKPTVNSPDTQEIVFVSEMNFESSIGGSVEFDKKWWDSATKRALPEIGDAANSRFRKYYKIAILTDGTLKIPNDKPGWAIDSGQIIDLDTDIVLTDDSENFVFIDLNAATGAVKTTAVYPKEDVGR
ncbi:MAG: prepilin-type N-terminal cleavage/methylation domain-containing protein [Planctomycetota bacterium]